MLRTMGAILLAFPLLEIATTYAAAQLLGNWLWIWLLLAAAGGLLLIRRQAHSVMRGMALAMRRGEAPLMEVTAGIKIGAAAVLLLLPGVLSDLFAALLLLWVPVGKPVDSVASGVYEGEFSRVTPARQTLRR